MSTATANGEGARKAHGRALGWSLVAILVGAMVAPLGGYVYVAYAQEEGPAWQGQNPRGETWRGARQGSPGYTSASGPYTTNSFVANGGENWRNTRNGPVATYTPWVMALSLLAIGLFHIVVGRSRLEGPRTGRRVQRWAAWERALHWFTATTFILMAITGLSLMFGRAVLIPVLGAQGFSAWATFSMGLHNFLGPLFTVGVLLIIIVWIKDNIPNRVDLEWFRKGGGMFGGEHPSAGRMNGGEKVWFWFVVIGGGIVCVTGLILDFPNFGQSREVMQLSNVLHAVVGIIWIAIAFGHIYIGTAGTEGAVEGMTTGYVSEEWARQHHDLWLEQVKAREGTAPPATEEPAPGGPAHGPAQRSP